MQKLSTEKVKQYFFFLKLKQQIHTKLVVQMQDCNVYVLIYKMAVAQTFCHGAAI